jgi:hypothetical protein
VVKYNHKWYKKYLELSRYKDLSKMSRNSRHYNDVDLNTTTKVYITYNQFTWDSDPAVNEAVESNCVVLLPEVNEWLTENCDCRWRVYSEAITEIHYNIFGRMIPSGYVHRNFVDRLKPFIGFQSKDDAILFKLTF